MVLRKTKNQQTYGLQYWISAGSIELFLLTNGLVRVFIQNPSVFEFRKLQKTICFWQISAVFSVFAPEIHSTYGLTVAPRKSQKNYTHLRNATESVGLSVCSCVSAVQQNFIVQLLCSKKIALSCSHMCQKHTKYRTCKTRLTEQFLENVFLLAYSFWQF